MSWKMQSWAKKVSKDMKLTSTERSVLKELADQCRNDEGEDIFPSLATLVDETAFTERTIRRTIGRLMDLGIIAYGDQSAALHIPAYKRPKVYKLDLSGIRKLNLGSVGRMPRPKRRMPWQPKAKAAPAPVDKSPQHTPPRPDIETKQTGQETGHSVHQSFKSLKEKPVQPPADAVPASPEVVNYADGQELLRAIRARRALRAQRHPVPA